MGALRGDSVHDGKEGQAAHANRAVNCARASSTSTFSRVQRGAIDIGCANSTAPRGGAQSMVSDWENASAAQVSRCQGAGAIAFFRRESGGAHNV